MLTEIERGSQEGLVGRRICVKDVWIGRRVRVVHRFAQNPYIQVRIILEASLLYGSCYYPYNILWSLWSSLREGLMDYGAEGAFTLLPVQTHPGTQTHDL